MKGGGAPQLLLEERARPPIPRAARAVFSSSSFRDAPFGAGPESILTMVVMDSRLALRAPRNDRRIINAPLHPPCPARACRPPSVRPGRLHPRQGVARPGAAGTRFQRNRHDRPPDETVGLGRYLAGRADRR